jgi:hypothetical protein
MLNRNVTILIFLFCYSLIFFRWANIPISDTVSEARIGVYGDAFSSRNVYSAAMWYKDMGFKKTKGLPVFNYTGNFNPEGTEVYTHYPPLPDLLGGTYARVLNTKNPYTLALVPLLLSILFFFFLRQAVFVLLPDRRSAMASWLLLVMSCYFICWADDLHQHLYTELLKWLYIFILFRYFNTTAKKWMVTVLCSIYFIQSWLTFEAIPYLAIITVGFFIVFTKKIFNPVCILLLIIPLLAVGLHLVQNYLYFGSWDAVIGDMKNALLKRTAGAGDWGNELGRPVQGFDFIKMWGSELWFRIGRMFTIPGIPFLALAIFALSKFYREHRLHFKMAIIFLLAGIAWIFVMPQHAFIHTFTVKHLAVFIAFVSGYGLVKYAALVKMHFRRGAWYWKIFHVLAIGSTLYGIAYNQVYYVYLKFGFAYPNLGTDARLW